jgi:muramoyltetrapeptide carboxypeptidase
MNSSIQPLQKGDLIEILAPAKAIEAEHVDFAKSFLEQQGFKVQISEHCLGEHNYFSGTIGERLSDFQKALDNPDIKAILCARGGYGCVQIVDSIQWANALLHPKWIIGFSDVTVLHQRMNKLGHPSIHGSMPLNFQSNTEEALSTIMNAVSGEQYAIECLPTTKNKLGEAEGQLLGGNLSILYSLLGTDDQVDYTGSILFIEDLAEHLYAIDRMFHAFRKAGILENIKGLVVGGMTNLKDTATPFGMTYQELILSHFEYRNIPICFDFPAGHIDDNRALILGGHVRLSVTDTRVCLNF